MKFIKSKKLKDRIDSVNDLIDPIYLVENLGFKVTVETPKEVRASCIIHGGDNTTAFRLNKELKTWTCFTHKCNEEYGNDMIGLVRSVNNCGFMEALEYLENLTGATELSKEEMFAFKRKRERASFMRQYSKDTFTKPAVVDDKKLQYYKPFRSSYFNARGFSDETLDFFEIAGGYKDNEGLIRDIIPIRDDHEDLVAYSLRDVREGVTYDKKYKLTSGFDKDSVLYNLYRAKLFTATKPLILVEGFKSVWRLHDYGIHNVVACMGAGITLGQSNLLFTYANEHGVVTFFDNDLAGAEAIGRTYELLKGKLTVNAEMITEVDENGKGLDPADLTKEQIYYYLSNYV